MMYRRISRLLSSIAGRLLLLLALVLVAQGKSLPDNSVDGKYDLYAVVYFLYIIDESFLWSAFKKKGVDYSIADELAVSVATKIK